MPQANSKATRPATSEPKSRYPALVGDARLMRDAEKLFAIHKRMNKVRAFTRKARKDGKITRVFKLEDQMDGLGDVRDHLLGKIMTTDAISDAGRCAKAECALTEIDDEDDPATGAEWLLGVMCREMIASASASAGGKRG